MSSPLVTGSQSTRAHLKVSSEQVRLLYRQMPAYSLALTHLVVGGMLVYLFWDNYAHNTLLVWFTTLCVLNVVRITLAFAYSRHEWDDEQIQYWAGVSIGFAIIFGSLWGSTAFLFLNTGDPENLVVITLMIGGLCTGAMVALTTYPASYFGFVIPALGMLISVLIASDEPLSAVLAILMGLILVGSIFYSIKSNRVLYESLRLSRENIHLREEMEKKTEILENTLHNSIQGICMTDLEGRLQLWNEAFLRPFGLSSGAEIHGHNLFQLVTDVYPYIALQQGDIKVYQLSNGTAIEVSSSELSSGSIIWSFIDVTESNKRECKLRENTRSAEQANVAKTRFLAAASHDIRQPLHAMGLIFSTLADEIRNTGHDELVQQMETSIKSVDSMLITILEISKLDAGIIEPEVAPVPVSAILTRMHAEFQSSASEKNLTLRFRHCVATVSSDKMMLIRILRNLISNAIRYTSSGGVLVGTRIRQHSLIFEVYDTGRGIKSEYLHDIFNEFHQLKDKEQWRQRIQGLGLGLSIVKRLCNLLGHQIQVNSEPDRGSRFSVTVPISVAMPQPVVVGNNSQMDIESHLKGRRILVLDDDPMVLNAMRLRLEHWGCVVDTAISAAEAIEGTFLKRSHLDLLIIDQSVVDSGLVFDRLNNLQNPIAKRTLILAITGDTDPDRLKLAKKNGFPLLHKPVQPARLRAVLIHLFNPASSLTLEDRALPG